MLPSGPTLRPSRVFITGSGDGPGLRAGRLLAGRLPAGRLPAAKGCAELTGTELPR